MAEQDARGALAVARQEGLAEGTANAILAVLSARGLAVDDRIRERILGCSDTVTLGRWLARAATAGSAEEVIVTPSEPM